MNKDKTKIQKKPTKPDIKKLQTEIQQLTDNLQRSHAEMINFKRRAQEEKAALMQSAKASVVTDFIEVIDNFGRVVASIPNDLESNDWAKGVTAVARQLSSVLDSIGVEKIDSAKGTPFDPNFHEAVMVDETDGNTEVVDEELQSGYKIDDIVLRPAKVKVTHINN